jgi:hypothetical protein
MSFTVTYDPNGATAGTVPTDTTSYSSGQPVTVLGDTGKLKRGDDTWARWNTIADGTGTRYGPFAAGTFNITSNVTLYAQWYTTTGLTDLGAGAGVTRHFQLHYESSLQGLGLEPARTNGVLAAGSGGKPICENDYQIMADWFGGITLDSVYDVPLPVYVANLGGGANVQGVITLKPEKRDVNFLRYLYVAEITELFMDSQKKGWFSPDGVSEQSCGEGLSRFLSQQFLVKTGLGFSEPGSAISFAWLNSSLPPGTPGSSQLGGQLTVLTTAVDNTVTSLPVKDPATIPFATTFLIQIDDEQMLVNSVDAGSLTMNVTRGYNGTAAAAHANSAPVLENYGSRADYVNLTLEYDSLTDASGGCAMLFLYYLNVQLGFHIPDIIDAAPTNAQSCLRGVYNKLADDPGDPFPFFKTLLDDAFPPNQISNIPGPNGDNPWPLGSLTFWGAKDTWGSDEVTDIINNSGGLYPMAFWLVLEGFNKQVAGSVTPSNPVIAFPGVHALLDTNNIVYESSNPKVPQRIRFPYNLIFDPSIYPAFPTTGETPALVTSSINLLGTDFPTTGEFFFVAGANPYFTNVLPNPNPANDNAPYLSGDLRVFTATPALNDTPVPNAPPFSTEGTQGAYDYISGLIPWLNQNHGDPSRPDPFDPNSNVIPGQQNALVDYSSVTQFTTNNGQKLQNYNFAVARVRLRGQPGTAHAAEGVKVFFRLWGTNSADSNWNPNSTYLSHTDTGDTNGIPLWPLAPPDNHTIPFFATNTRDFTSSTNGEFGATGVNNQTIQIKQGDAQWAFFGCFLDVYDTDLTVNNVQIVKAFPGDHHCLVAEIAYVNAPIKNVGTTIMSPYNSDKLAQRNLQVTPSANPGPATAHRIPQTFETHMTTRGERPHQKPDELMIDWGDVPEGSVAYIYWPQVNAQEILALALQLYGTHQLSLADAHTIRCVTVKGATYVPIPFGTGPGLAGLFTVDLPLTVVVKQVFNILVTRITTRPIVRRSPPPMIAIQRTPRHPKTLETRPLVPLASGPSTVKSAVGSFRVNIPVANELDILPSEIDKLAVFKARLAAMPPNDRWYPVLERYVGYISGRVDGLGGPGTAASVPPSFGGGPEPCPPGTDEVCCTGHVTGLCFDGCGEFEGFMFCFDEDRKNDDKVRFLEPFKYTLEQEKRQDYRIKTCEAHVRKLVEHAWHENLRITICLSSQKPCALRHIILRDFCAKGDHGSGVFGKLKQKVM